LDGKMKKDGTRVCVFWMNFFKERTYVRVYDFLMRKTTPKKRWSYDLYLLD
jgi:hypothetical protein